MRVTGNACRPPPSGRTTPEAAAVAPGNGVRAPPNCTSWRPASRFRGETASALSLCHPRPPRRPTSQPNSTSDLAPSHVFDTSVQAILGKGKERGGRGSVMRTSIRLGWASARCRAGSRGDDAVGSSYRSESLSTYLRMCQRLLKPPWQSLGRRCMGDGVSEYDFAFIFGTKGLREECSCEYAARSSNASFHFQPRPHTCFGTTPNEFLQNTYQSVFPCSIT